MSDANREIIEAIQRIAGTWGKDFITVIAAKVVSVDDAEMTCKVDPINDTSTVTINNVLLSAEANDGMVQYPSVDSIVLVAYGVKQQPFIMMFSDIDKCRITIENCDFFIDKNGIKLFGDNFGGLVKIEILNAALNNLQTEINTLKSTLVGNLTAMGVALSAVDGGVTTAQAGVLGSVQLPQINISQIENTKVQHGNI